MYKKIFDFSKLIGEIDILIFCNPAPLSKIYTVLRDQPDDWISLFTECRL